VTAPTPKNEVERVAVRFAAAMGADPESMYALLADTFVRRGEQTAWQPLGKANYVAMSENFLSAYPDVRWEVVDVLSDGNRVVLHMVERGTFTAAWTIGDITVQPTGGEYTSRGMVLMTIDDGLISEYTLVQDGGFRSAFGEIFTDEFGLAYYEFLIDPYLEPPT
jgi:predicted ester cyclase